MPSVEVRMGACGTLECVQTLPHRTITDRVHVNLKALGRQGRSDVDEVVGGDEREPAGLCFARCSAVRREHRGGAVFTDPVLHDLDRGGTEAVVPRPLSSGSKLNDLIEPAFGAPPQCTDDSRSQLTGFVGVEVGRQDVVESEQRNAHPGVLPAGDAHRVQMSLSCKQGTVHEIRCDGGYEVGDRIGRSLEEHPRWRAFLVANDPAASGIGCAAVYPNDLQRLGIGPDSVPVVAGQHHRPRADRGVDVIAGWKAPWECVAIPAAPADHRFVGMCAGMVTYCVDVGRAVVGEPGKVTAQGLHAGSHGMDVRIDESGKQASACGVDDLGARPDEVLGHAASHIGDHAAADGNRIGRAQRAVRDEHRGVDEQGVSDHGGSVQKR